MVERKKIRDEPGFGASVALFIFTIAVAVVTFSVAMQKEQNQLATGLLQAITIGLSFATAHVYSQIQAQRAAADVLKPHARSAFRRGVGISTAFGRLADSIQKRQAVLDKLAAENDGLVSIQHVQDSMELLLVQANEQQGVALDALEDWRDVVPEEIASVEEQLKGRNQ